MDLDLDLFERRDDRPRRGRHRIDDDHDDDDDDRPRRRARWYSRREHPHVFSWLLLGGGAVLLGLALVVAASSLGLWGAIADGYFAASTAVLPASWHAGWLALPGVVHVAIVLGALFVAAGAAGELLD